jgi:hypothetical protein
MKNTIIVCCQCGALWDLVPCGQVWDVVPDVAPCDAYQASATHICRPIFEAAFSIFLDSPAA